MGMMAAEKKSFVLYHDIRTPLELLTDEQRGKLFIALLDYSEHGELPDFDGALLMAFAFIRTSLDRDAEAWAEKRAKRAEAGRNGGLAKAANASIASGAKQSVANLAVNVPVNVPAPVPVNLSTTTGGGRGTADKPPRASRFTPSLDDPYCEVVPEGYTRSVLLALDDVTPAVFRFVRSEFTLHRYCVLPDGQIEDTAYQMELGLDYCSCAELMLYYNERMGAYCCAYLNDISLAYTGINGYYATTYILDDTGARLYRRWDQVWLEWDDEKHRNAVSDMSSAGWPYLKEEIMNRETLPYTYWMFKCESWISGGESAAEWRYSRRYWTAEELEAYEKEIRGEPRTPDFSKKTAAQPSDAADDANTKALLTYIDTLPYDTIADSARKLVDAYADMLNSTDSGEGIFYPDETDANRFWTAIYNYEIDQRGYLDADDVNYWMYKGYRMDSRQNVQDVANAMYGHIVELPPRDYVPSYCPKDSDTCYYFGIGDRGAVQVALDGFERSEDGSAVLKLSYSYPMDGLYMTALAKLRVNPNVNLNGEIPFYYMIESVEIRYA